MAEVKFLLGTEEGEKQAWLDSEKQRLKKEHPDMETVNLFAFETGPQDLEEALFSTSLFSSFSLVVLKHYEEVKKDSPLNKVILGFIQDSQATNELVVLSTQTAYSLPAPIAKALKKEDTIVFWEMFENRKQDWIRSFFRREGWSITQDAISYILDMIENNTLEMKNTCTQLAIFLSLQKKETRTVDLDDIASYLSHTRSEDGFSLFASIARADLAKSLGCLKKILDSDSRGGLALTPVLTRQFRLLESYILIRQSQGQEAAEKNASALQTGPFEVKGIRTQRDKQTFSIASQNYTLDQTMQIIFYLDTMDTKAKMASTDELPLVLELMVYTIICNKGKETGLRLERELFDDSLSYRERY